MVLEWREKSSGLGVVDTLFPSDQRVVNCTWEHRRDVTLAGCCAHHRVVPSIARPLLG